MAKEKFLCVMAQFDQQTEQRMHDVQEVLRQAGIVGKQTKNLPFHITLGIYDLHREKEIAQCVANACAGCGEFTLHFSGLGLFGLTVLFFAPVVNRELLCLHGHFPGDSRDAFIWTPHATLLIDEADTVLKALPLVDAHYAGFGARVESISLYEFWPGRCIENRRLGQE